jgi:putative ABC transport system permease protein
VLRVGGAGLRTRPLRAFLSALGIAIGIAAMIAVVGISTSSRADLDRQLAALGTNLLTVAPGNRPVRRATHTCPTTRSAMIGRIGPVESVSAPAVTRRQGLPQRPHPGRRRPAASPCSPPAPTCSARSAPRSPTAPGSTRDRPLPGRRARLDRRRAARHRPGRPDAQVWLGGRWFTVVGILARCRWRRSSTPRRWSAGRRPSLLGFDGHPTTVYTRDRETTRSRTSARARRHRQPGGPNEVKVSRPSDALAAKQATDKTFTGLLLGLGAVALLVGGVGVANTMVISVLERRAEIGLRRSLGATRARSAAVPRRVAAAVRARRRRRRAARHRRHRAYATDPAGRPSCRPWAMAGGSAPPSSSAPRRPLPGHPGRPARPDGGRRPLGCAW